MKKVEGVSLVERISSGTEEVLGSLEGQELVRALGIADGLIRAQCEGSFRDFVIHAWPVLEPEVPLVWNWHLDYLCAELEYQVRRIKGRRKKLYDLVINVPPRSLKSTLISKMLNAWAWVIDPTQKFLTASYASDLALEHAVSSRRLISSDWYQRYWGGRFRMTGDQNVKAYFENSKTGYRMSIGLGGSGVGRGGNWCIVDDPISPADAMSDAVRATTNEWYAKTFWTRLNNANVDIRVIIMQRLHENDTTGYVLGQTGHRYKHICLPAMESDDIRPAKYRSKYVGGLLFPERLGREFLVEAKATLGEYGFSGQFMQAPSPAEGGIFKRQYWRFWVPGEYMGRFDPVRVKLGGGEIVECKTEGLPLNFDDKICSWDMTFKDKQVSDYVVGQVWGSVGARRYLLDQFRDKVDFVGTVQAVRNLKHSTPGISAILIEEAANGAAAIAELQRDTPGVIGVPPRGSKFSRALPLSKQAEAGNIYLPHPRICPWVEGLIERFAAFPNVKNDDEIDTASLAIDRISSTTRIFTGFQSYFGGHIMPIKIDFQGLEEQTTLIVSQWADSMGYSSVILAAWNSRQHRLAIFDEIIGIKTQAELVIAAVCRAIRVSSMGFLQNARMFQWYGNKIMAGEVGHDIGALYSKYGIWIQPNEKYNETGAIEMVNRLLFRGSGPSARLIVSPKCVETIRQMPAWNIGMGNKPVELGFGACHAICNMVANLNETGKMVEAEQPEPAYSVLRTNNFRNDERNLAAGNILSIANRIGGANRDYADVDGPGSWMIG
jgi:predicted phage terminase large subunit-like protein